MPLTHLDCTKCDRRFEPGRVLNLCECGAPLFARYDLERAAKEMRPGHLALREPTMWRYREVLPIDDPDDRVSLGELDIAEFKRTANDEIGVLAKSIGRMRTSMVQAMKMLET